jgi:hypothetical protein
VAIVAYVLLGLTVASVLRLGWTSRQTVPAAPAALTGVLLVATIASGTVAWRDGRTSTRTHAAATTASRSIDAGAQASTTLVTGLAVPTSVAGEVLDRAEFERLQTCEAALTQIAATVAATPHTTDDMPSLIADPDPEASTERARLSRCEVRLSAIAATVRR